MKVLLLVFMLGLGCHAQTAPPLPTLPDQYEAWITCNIVNRNYSVDVHEIYDYPQNRLLVSRYHPGTDPTDSDHGQATDLYLYEHNELLHTNDSGCYGYRLDDLPRGRGAFAGGAGAGRIPASKDFFRFNADGQDEIYQGQKRVNGVLCDHWISDLSNATANVTMILDYYFTSAGWTSSVPEFNANFTSLPFLLNLTGSRPEFDRRTHQPTGSLHYFQHFYSYHGWRVGPQVGHRHGHDVFTIPSDIANCTGNITMVPRSNSSAAACDSDDDDGNITMVPRSNSSVPRSNSSAAACDSDDDDKDDDDMEELMVTVGLCVGSAVLGGIIVWAMMKLNTKTTKSGHTTFNNPVARYKANNEL